VNSGKYPFYIGGGLLCFYSLLLLVGNIMMLTSPGFELTAEPFMFLFLQITPEGFAFLYILLPALIVILFAVTVILRERLFYSGTSIWILRISFLCVAINAAVTYTSPVAIENMYDSLQAWSGIDILGLFGTGALWIAALFAVGCYLALSLGFHLIEEYYPASFLIVRTISLAVVLFAWIPALIAHDSLDPNRTIVKPMLVAFCLLYYIIFENLRSRFSKSTDSSGYRKYSIPKLLITTVVMSILLIPYLHTVYLFIESWATLLVAGFLVFVAHGKGKSYAESKREMDEFNRRQSAERERLSQRRIAQLNQNTYGKKD
jgi:hypothetical protein